MKEASFRFVRDTRQSVSRVNGKTVFNDVLVVFGVFGGLMVATVFVHLLVAQMFG